jgi:hypothetical protein
MGNTRFDVGATCTRFSLKSVSQPIIVFRPTSEQAMSKEAVRSSAQTNGWQPQERPRDRFHEAVSASIS